MKRILSILITLLCLAAVIYGCAAGQSTPSESVAEESSAEPQPRSILLCLPNDGEDYTLLRAAFTAQAQANGYEALISQPTADSEMTDEQVWDIAQLQYEADAAIIYNCDGVEEGLVKKWSDAGTVIIAAGKRLDGQMQSEGSTLSRLIRVNVAYADGALSKAISSHVIDTLSAAKTGAGFVAMFGNTDAQLEFLNFVKADIQLTDSTYTPNAPIPAGDALSNLTEVSAARAVIYYGSAPADWVAAAAQVNTSALLGVCSCAPEALTALQAQTVDFVAVNDPVDLMTQAVSAAHGALTSDQAITEWSPTAATLVLTGADPRLATYLSYLQ